MLLGVAEFERALKRVAAQADRAARRNVVEAAATLEKLAKAGFEGTHEKGKPHVGGDRPNVVTGALRRSIHHTPISRLGFALYSTEVGPSTVYARRVELGYAGSEGRGHDPTRAFPYFSPAYAATRELFPSIAAHNWNRFMLGR